MKNTFFGRYFSLSFLASAQRQLHPVELQGVQDQNFRIQMLISLSIFDLGEKFQVLRRFEKYTFFSSQ